MRLPRVPGVEHPVAASLARPDVRGRVPTFADLKAVYQDKELRIPESVVKTTVTQLLGRIAREKRLKSADSVAAIVARIFPAPGVISEAEFTKALDVADRTAIYRSVLDADTTVRRADRAKLRGAMKAAAALIRSIEGDDVGLKAVFGAEAPVAKANYARARATLAEVSRDMATKVSTDYNLDDPEVSLGGWASHGARHMHLLVEIVKVIDAKESKITLIHEAAHLADPSVDDHGYYGTPNFEALGEDVKVGNAGHYEELPRRKLGTSSYSGLTFTPGVLKGGGAVTWEDTIRRESSEYLRKAWDAAVDTHTWLRGVRRAFLPRPAAVRGPAGAHPGGVAAHGPDRPPPGARQGPGHPARRDADREHHAGRHAGRHGRRREPVEHPYGPWLDPRDEDVAARHILIDDAVSRYGRLLGDPVRDRALLDWLVAHYRSVPSSGPGAIRGPGRAPGRHGRGAGQRRLAGLRAAGGAARPPGSCG